MSDHDSSSGAGLHGPLTRAGQTADEAIQRDAEDRHGQGGDGHHGEEHGHGGLGTYLAVFVALCVLTTMSFFTYSAAWPWRDQPEVGWAFMMAVSCTKAMLVVLFFMHVLWEANWKYVLTIPAAMMAVFLTIMLVPDIGLRNRMVSQERALHMARPSDVRLLEDGGAAAAKPAADAH